MFDINLKIRAEELGKTLDNLADQTKEILEGAIGQIAQATYSEGVRLAQQRLKTTKQDYLNSFNLYELGDGIYVISLTGDHANSIEDGWAPFNMINGFLNGPKAKISKKGIIYNTIPFSYKPYSKAPLNEKSTQLRDAVKQVLKQNGIDKILKGPDGTPLQGKVATILNTGIKELNGLVKYQKTYDKATQSTYMTFRRVSERTLKSKWNHPGFGGAKIFPDLENYITEQVDRILNTVL